MFLECSAFRHFIALRACPWLVWGRLSVIIVLSLLIEVFFWMLCLPLALWLWHWSTVVCKRQSIRAPGFTQLLLCCCNFILGKFVSFPGDEAWAAFAPAQAIAEGLESCFVIQVSRSGCGAWESAAWTVTTTCQNECHSPFFCHIFFL